MKQYAKQDQIALATWAVDCAERVLPLFEQAYPEDDRPCQALEACRTWVRTGLFTMAAIRGASLLLSTRMQIFDQSGKGRTGLSR